MSLRFAQSGPAATMSGNDISCELPDARECRPSLWFNALCLLLLGYAICGKGFAYLGIYPLFVGEIILLTGGLLFLLSGNWRYVLGYPPVWSLLLLAGWGVLTTYPHLSAYGIDSLRDAMIWGYAAFAPFVMGVLLAVPERLVVLMNRYEKASKLILLGAPCAYLVTQLELLPTWPWANVSIIHVKGGDVLTHLAGVFAFWASGLGRRVNKVWILIMLCSVAIVGSASRGGLVAFLMAFMICLAFRPFSRMLWSILFGGFCILVLIAAIDFKYQVPGTNREVSTEQMTENITSVFESSQNRNLDSTKQWRLNWWSDIVNYTWNGKYFWTGKGFGINLADDDGYQGTQWDGLLRSPHNGHMTMLARAGVPGFAIWLLPQLLWCWLIISSALRSMAWGDRKWNSLFVFLLAYWAALLTTATFDVYLEGPVGGIWFWSIYGVGLAAVVIYRYCPEVFVTQENDAEIFS